MRSPLLLSLLLPLLSSLDLDDIPPPIMPTSCHMISCMPGMVCRMTEPAVCSSPPCTAEPTCVEGEDEEEEVDEQSIDEGELKDPVADKLGEHSTSPEEPVRRNRPHNALSSNWSRGGSAPLLDVDTTKLVEDSRKNLMRMVMNQQPSTATIGEFIVDLVCLIRGTCQCNANERYKTCGGCEGTCDNFSPSCPARCGPARCECLAGFVRFSNVCIPSRDCPTTTTTTTTSRPWGPGGPPRGPGGGPRGPWGPGGRPGVPGPPGSGNCSPDEEWDQCGARCERSCAVPNGPPCPPRCSGFGGCRCRPGTVRHWNGRCHPANWCSWNAPTTNTTTTTTTTTQPPNVCGRNEVFTTCSSGCEPSCYYPSQNCGNRCYAPSCQCARGYYRRPSPYNDCVAWGQCMQFYSARREERPDECREHEVFKQCTTLCEATCANRRPTCASTCGPPGCECSSGYLRVSVHESVCIPPDMCV